MARRSAPRGGRGKQSEPPTRIRPAAKPPRAREKQPNPAPFPPEGPPGRPFLPPGVLGQVGGGLLLVAGIWIGLARGLGTDAWQTHPLGPWVGGRTDLVLRWALGDVPSILLPLVLLSGGWVFLLGSGAATRIRHVFAVLVVTWTHLVVFLALRGQGEPLPPPERLMRMGGALGHAIVDTLFVPVFGEARTGTVLLLLLTLIGGLLLATQTAPRTVALALHSWLREVLHRAVEILDRRRRTRREAEALRGLVQDGGALALGVEPHGRFLDRRLMPEPDEGEEPLPLPTVLDARRPQRKERPRNLVSPSPVTAAVTGNSPEEDDAQALLGDKARGVWKNLSQWRPLRSEDLEGLNPLEIRQLKARDEEFRRASELNAWEDRKVLASVRRQPEPEAASSYAVRPPSELEAPTPRIERPEAIPEAPPGIPRTKPEADAAYRVPDPSILPDPPRQEIEIDEELLRARAEDLSLQLRNFGVSARVVQIEPGPVITRFKLELAPGTPVRKIANLGDDLALALRARRLRIEAPIPGEALVGLEVPNAAPEIVHLRDILSSTAFRDPRLRLPIALGKDIVGNAVCTDLARAPHLLIAGQTGSGKSVCLNAIMASILFSQSPSDCRLVLVDPKVVELAIYERIPHLLAPVVTRPEEAVAALKWVTAEMDRRYDVLAAGGVRNIAGFNERFASGALPEDVAPEDRGRMPFLVVVIDEFADLMMVAGKEVETSVARIAQKARAVGIHLILATQRPSTNVITGVIKANLPTRIAFQVASQIDARTILDHQGAEELLGRGDMLFRAVDAPEPRRLHGAFVGDREAEMIATATWSQDVTYERLPGFEAVDGTESDDDGALPSRLDAKFAESARLVVLTRQGSVSMLQRRMGMGFARAGKVMDQLERAGIVGRDRGSKAREVLLDDRQLEDLLDRLGV